MTEITETICRPKRSWMTAPGIQIKQTLDECIAEVFGFPEIYLTAKGRYVFFMYAKHLKRYILERLMKDGTLAPGDMRRNKHFNRLFKFTVYRVAEMTNCNHATVIHASRTCQNLMETDRFYREKCLKVIEKLNNNLLILPE